MGQTWFDRKARLQSNDLFRLGSALDPGSTRWRRSLCRADRRRVSFTRSRDGEEVLRRVPQQ